MRDIGNIHTRGENCSIHGNVMLNGRMAFRTLPVGQFTDVQLPGQIIGTPNCALI